MTKLIQRHEIVVDYKRTKITDEEYDAFIRSVNQLIVDNKDEGHIKVIFTGSGPIGELTFPDGKFFPFPDEIFESVYKRFKKDLKKTEYNVTSYNSITSGYYAVIEIEW